MDSVKELMSDKLKGTNRAQGVLCYLFRTVVLWRKINLFAWNKRLQAYVEKPHNKKAGDTDKGNLNKAFLNDDMNWASFKKSIDFLSPMEATLDIELTWGDDSTSNYRLIIDPTENEVKLGTNHLPFDHCDVFKDAKPPKTTITHLFRHIVAEEGIDLAKWEQLFVDWENNPYNTVGMTPKDIKSTINTLRRSILEPKVSWNVFRRGILLLRPRQERYTLTLKWTDDPNLKNLDVTDSIHEVTIFDPYREN